MRILIVGGGISGLALAALLQKEGYKPLIIEKAPTWRNIGYAIILLGNGVNVLKELCLYDQIMKNSCEFHSFEVANNKGKIIKKVNLTDISNKHGPILGVERTVLHSSLASLVKEIPVRFNTTVKELFHDNNDISITFSDSSKESFDLVIGADGMDSATRQQLFNKNYLHYYNWAVWMTWFNSEQELEKKEVVMLGLGKAVGMYSVSPKKHCVMFFMQKDHNVHEKKIEHSTFLKAYFRDFGGIVPSVLEQLTNSSQIYFDDLKYVELSEWHKGRIGIIGDAQHAVSPITAIGCSVALEDASVLSKCISETTSSNISKMLDLFAKARQERMKLIKKQSRLLWNWFGVGSPLISSFRNIILPFMPVSYFMKGYYKILSARL